jgi:hypothetical protein
MEEAAQILEVETFIPLMCQACTHSHLRWEDSFGVSRQL